MQMKKAGRYSKLVLGGILALAVSNAQADITPQMWTSSSTLSDLGLNVWDQSAGTSYGVDLNLDLTSFRAQAATTNMTWDLDSIFTSFASTGDALTFNIAGANYGTGTTDPNDALMFSYETGKSGTNYFPSTLKTSQVNANQNIVQSEYGVTLALSGGGEMVNSTNPGYFNYAGGWGIGQGGTQNRSTVYGGSGANSLSVVFYNSPGGTVVTSTPFTTTKPTGYFSLSQTGGSYYLNWTSSAVSAVPVPGAVWLFLGGMMTLLGFQKRKAGV
jgi:hypothetical protein